MVQHLFPLDVFIAFQVETNGFDILQDGFDSFVGVGGSGVGVVAKNVFHVIVGVFIILEKVPEVGWAELVHELSLFELFLSEDFVIFTLVASYSFFISDSFFLVSLDEVSQTVSLQFIGF